MTNYDDLLHQGLHNPGDRLDYINDPTTTFDYSAPKMPPPKKGVGEIFTNDTIEIAQNPQQQNETIQKAAAPGYLSWITSSFLSLFGMAPVQAPSTTTKPGTPTIDGAGRPKLEKPSFVDKQDLKRLTQHIKAVTEHSEKSANAVEESKIDFNVDKELLALMRENCAIKEEYAKNAKDAIVNGRENSKKLREKLDKILASREARAWKIDWLNKGETAAAWITLGVGTGLILMTAYGSGGVGLLAAFSGKSASIPFQYGLFLIQGVTSGINNTLKAYQNNDQKEALLHKFELDKESQKTKGQVGGIEEAFKSMTNSHELLKRVLDAQQAAADNILQQ